MLLELLDISDPLLLCLGLGLLLILSVTGHGCADPVSTGTDAAVTVHLGLSPISVHFILQGTFLLWRVEGWIEALEELLEAEFPVSIFIRQLNESINTESSKQLVVLLVCVGGDVDGGFILLHKFQELTGVQARVTIIKVLKVLIQDFTVVAAFREPAIWNDLCFQPLDDAVPELIAVGLIANDWAGRWTYKFLFFAVSIVVHLDFGSSEAGISMQLTVVEVGLAVAATHRPLVRFALLNAEAGGLSLLCDCTFPTGSAKHIGTDLGFAP